MRIKKEGGPIKINNLLDVYKKRLKAPERTVIQTFQEVVSDILKISIPDAQCSYSPNTKTLTIRNNGQVRSEILMHKKEILTHLKGRLGEKNTPKEVL